MAIQQWRHNCRLCPGQGLQCRPARQNGGLALELHAAYLTPEGLGGLMTTFVHQSNIQLERRSAGRIQIHLKRINIIVM